MFDGVEVVDGVVKALKYNEQKKKFEGVTVAHRKCCFIYLEGKYVGILINGRFLAFNRSEIYMDEDGSVNVNVEDIIG